MACELCDGQGHIRDGSGNWKRCACIRQEIDEQTLGVFYTTTPASTTSLMGLVTKNAVIESPLDLLRPHMARVLLNMREHRKQVRVMDCYRLLEIFLEKDEEFTSTVQTVDCDLMILLAGFGDPRNKYLPELMMQALGRREVLRLPTWVVLGCGMESVGMRYGADLAAKLGGFQRVKMK